MSATFRLSKSKVSQNDLRRLMNDYKVKSQPENDNKSKLNTPLAKYGEDGQLMCILCKSVVRSEKVWNVHINSKQHKDSIAQAKQLKEQTKNFTKAKSAKRPAEIVITTDDAAKRPKGILKNAPPLASSSNSTTAENSKPSENNVPFHNDEIKRAPLRALKNDSKKDKNNEQPNIGDLNIKDASIPEGFFDDPKMDAKARNVDYKDPIEEEWDRFQKEMREETSTSAAIIAGEQEEATAERQIDEIDEQIKNWSRVLDLERKKEETSKQKLQEMSQDANEESGSEDGDNFDEFLDWRSKMAYR